MGYRILATYCVYRHPDPEAFSAAVKASTVAVPMFSDPVNAVVPKIWFKVAAASLFRLTATPLR